MTIKDLSKFSAAEKIDLAEQIWDSITKEDILLNNEIEHELDYRLSLIEEKKTTFYSWDEVKSHLKKIR